MGRMDGLDHIVDAISEDMAEGTLSLARWAENVRQRRRQAALIHRANSSLCACAVDGPGIVEAIEVTRLYLEVRLHQVAVDDRGGLPWPGHRDARLLAAGLYGARVQHHVLNFLGEFRFEFLLDLHVDLCAAHAIVVGAVAL